jgi:hypothetical protein
MNRPTETSASVQPLRTVDDIVNLLLSTG